ncbi:MAG: AAA family ATPase [Nostoc sp. NOS(2021)]|uniref:ParA family partition ATPase n=1 Tax=Nostoc sp. NOS(2021) TaxID=2815407 RepID=UPI0025FA2762|nr:ParA family partition ATPase [Nostoc sp. NOS(2021)]MBN3893802.1 AAA family ATPase [Nostoc sp. NOS(2021)]
MKTIAIVARKGGTGKTTLAVNLGVAAFLNKKQVALIDLDPQGSLSSWGDSREDESPAVVSAQASRLTHILEAAEKNNADISIIDTAANAESTALAAIRCADLILIPTRPAIFDLRAIQDTADLVKMAHKSAFVVLNAVPPQGNLGDEAQTGISEQDIEVCPWRLTQRIAFVHAVTAGLSVQEYEPTGKAALEIKNLYRWVLKQLK